ncbi:unnamed protein product, partial [Rotaria sp. Silwood1]
MPSNFNRFFIDYLILIRFFVSQFDTGAASIIKLCFDDDEQFALDLLQRSDIAFKNLTLLELAKDAECKSFLASKCVQRHLDDT